MQPTMFIRKARDQRLSNVQMFPVKTKTTDNGKPIIKAKHRSKYNDVEPVEMGAKQRWRLDHLSQACTEEPSNKQITDHSFGLFKRILVDDERKYLYCEIFKAASTSWMKTLVGLTNYTGDYTTFNIRDTGYLEKYGLRYLNTYKNMTEIRHKIEVYFKFIIVRDPLKRLLSAYRDRFLKTKDRALYRNVIGRKIIEHYRQGSASPADTMEVVNFNEFVDYTTRNALKSGKLDPHWNTFQRNCRLCLINYDFIGKLETFNEDSNYILKRISTKNIKPVSSAHGPHWKLPNATEALFERYYKTLWPETYEQVEKVYHFDCKAFGYDCKEILEKMKKTQE